MPTLKTASQKSESIQIGMNTGLGGLGGDGDEMTGGGGKWEDEEERRFFEEIPDLKDYVPRSVLGLEGDGDETKDDGKEKERKEKERVEEEVRKLEEELAEMKIDADGNVIINGNGEEVGVGDDNADELVFLWFRMDASAWLTFLEAFRRLPRVPRRSRRPIHRSWLRRVRLNSSLPFLHAFQTPRTGHSSTRLLLTLRS